MKRLRHLLKHSVWLLAGLLVFAISPTQADDRPFDGLPAFDFADDFYRENGIKPEALVDRLVAQDERSVEQDSPDADFANIKILEITGGFDHKGHVLYYTVNAKVMPNTFTDDEAGDEALEVANAFRAFIFPKAAGNPLVPGAPNRRQDNVFDTRNGYFNNNPLGLWILTFVSWDGPNLTSNKCQDAIEDLTDENGLDLDGTPIIKTVSDLESLEKDGCVRFRTRNTVTGVDGFPWVV